MYFGYMDKTFNSSDSNLHEHNLINQLRTQNEFLKTQLMSTSMIQELTKVLHSCTDLEGIIKTTLLAIQEIVEFDRVILFEINKDSFSLKAGSWVGIVDKEIKDLSIPLGFEGGEITDALFLNKHIIVESPDPLFDIFHQKLNSSGYLVMPLVSKANKKCWEARSCIKTSCPAYGSYNPFCWSFLGCGQMICAPSENERRNACISCECFKGEGTLWMDRSIRRSPVTSDDITALSAIVNMAGIVIENFRILNALDNANNSLKQANKQLKIVNQDLQIAQSKIKGDLDHARSIQQGLLPQNLEQVDCITIGAHYLSADAVGGDYFDVFEITPGLYGLVVADVSGHGIASALIMSMVKVLLKTFSLNENSPQKTLEKINQTFLSEIKTDNFVTIFYAVLDTSNHTLSYTSAGHCPVIFLDRQNKSFRFIKADGLFMGVFPDMMLKESSYSYTPGNDRLVLFTDGLTEAKNDKDEMYGLERLASAAQSSIHTSPKNSVKLILTDQKTFCGERSTPEDDITLLIIDL
jgi:serine phosphatase RsbU (regulator of sigma subunit)